MCICIIHSKVHLCRVGGRNSCAIAAGCRSMAELKWTYTAWGVCSRDCGELKGTKTRRASCFNQFTLRVCTHWDLQNSVLNSTPLPVAAECGTGKACEESVPWWVILIIVLAIVLVLVVILIICLKKQQAAAVNKAKEVELPVYASQPVRGANLRGGSLFVTGTSKFEPEDMHSSEPPLLKAAARGHRGSVDGVGVPSPEFLAFEEDFDRGFATSSPGGKVNGLTPYTDSPNGRANGSSDGGSVAAKLVEPVQLEPVAPGRPWVQQVRTRRAPLFASSAP